MSPTTSWLAVSDSNKLINQRSGTESGTRRKEEPLVANREKLLTDTFVTLADTMVKDFDVVDFLSLLTRRCVELFDAGEAGLMLADPEGHMQLVASSSHQMRLLELLELQHDQGPCPEAYRTGTAVQVPDLHDAETRWPKFVGPALEAGYLSALALPLRLRDETIGALNLLRVEAGTLPNDDITTAQALADVATIGILQHRAATESNLLSEQLQYALDSRVIIEQAKGAIAQKLDLSTDEAFNALRRYSRSRNLRLVDVASAVVNRGLDASMINADQRAPVAETRRR